MVKSDLSHAYPPGTRPQWPDGPAVEQVGSETVDRSPAAGAEPKTYAPLKKLRPIDVIAAARRQLQELTGYPVDSVAGLGKSGDGWALTVSVIELGRIPATMDVLAEYAVDLDDAGDVTAYRRGRRFFRGQVGEVD